VCRAMSIVTSNNMAATATLFITTESTPAVSMSTVTMRASLAPARRSTWRPRRFATPVRVSPALRMNTAQTVTTAGLLKPLNAAAGVTNPVSANALSASSAVTSIGIHFMTSSVTATTRMQSSIETAARTVAIGGNPNYGGKEFLAASFAGLEVVAKALSAAEIEAKAKWRE